MYWIERRIVVKKGGLNILLSAWCFNDFSVYRDGDFDSLCKVSDVVTRKALTFIEDEKYVDTFLKNQSRFSCVITTEEIIKHLKDYNGGIAFSRLPKAAFLIISNSLPEVETESRPSTVGKNATIASSAFVSQTGVIIGENVTIEENVRIYPGVIIGDNVRVKFGALLGCQDYERCLDFDNHILSVKHRGLVRVSNNVQIDEYVIVDRPLFDWDETVVKEYSYIGKRAYISHGSKIGANVFVAPGAMICGNTQVGNNVRIGVGAIIGSRILIGDGAVVSLGSVVNKSVHSNERVTGNLAILHEVFMRHLKEIVNEHKEDSC